MKRTRFTDEQIIGILAEHEAGAKCADLCRKHGMSEGTFYNWKAKFGGMTVSEAKRLKGLEDENAKLKKLLAEHEVGAKCANLAHARVVIAAWAADYNIARPHSALDYQTSADYARALTTAIARPDARDESSARRAIAQPAPIGVNTNRAPVAAG